MAKKYYRKIINIGLTIFLILSSHNYSIAFTFDESTFDESKFDGNEAVTSAIPSINEWGIIILIVLLAFSSYFYLRKKEIF